MEHDRPEGVDAEPQVTKRGPQSLFIRIIIFPIDTTFNVYDQQRKSGTDPVDPIADINIMGVISAEMYYFLVYWSLGCTGCLRCQVCLL
jgi:hypothetical protein